MNKNLQNVASAYSRVDFETSINSASPHSIIRLLFEGALAAIVNARKFMLSNEISEKGQAINKASTIIDSGLRACLNMDTGGELEQNLDDLYQYMIRRLTEAHLHNNVEYLDEVHQLLSDINSAWVSLDTKNQEIPENTSQPQSINIAG